MLIRIAAAVLLLGLAAAASAGEKVRIMLAGKPERSGTLESIAQDGTLTVNLGAGAETVPLADVVELLFARGDFRPAADRTRLVLENGDRLVGTLAGGTEAGDGLVFQDSALGRITFADFGKVRWILFPSAREKPELPEGKRASDVVFRGEEGSISGSLAGFGATALKLERTDLKIQIEIPYDEIRAVYVAPLLEPKPAEGLRAAVTLTNGDVLTGAPQGTAPTGLRFALDCGVTAVLPFDRLATLGARNGNFTFLSDLTPGRITENPWLFDEPVTHTPPFEGKPVVNYRRDASYTGAPLRIGGRTYLKGIGSHSRTEIEYALNGAWRLFEAHVGIDDSAGGAGRGSVVFRVLVDGKELLATPPVFGGEEPRELRVEVTGARTLVLVVDYTHAPLTVKDGREEDHVLDRADWAAARLVK